MSLPIVYLHESFQVQITIGISIERKVERYTAQISKPNDEQTRIIKSRWKKSRVMVHSIACFSGPLLPLWSALKSE